MYGSFAPTVLHLPQPPLLPLPSCFIFFLFFSFFFFLCFFSSFLSSSSSSFFPPSSFSPSSSSSSPSPSPPPPSPHPPSSPPSTPPPSPPPPYSPPPPPSSSSSSLSPPLLQHVPPPPPSFPHIFFFVYHFSSSSPPPPFILIILFLLFTLLLPPHHHHFLTRPSPHPLFLSPRYFSLFSFNCNLFFQSPSSTIQCLCIFPTYVLVLLVTSTSHFSQPFAHCQFTIFTLFIAAFCRFLITCRDNQKSTISVLLSFSVKATFPCPSNTILSFPLWYILFLLSLHISVFYKLSYLVVLVTILSADIQFSVYLSHVWMLAVNCNC